MKTLPNSVMDDQTVTASWSIRIISIVILSITTSSVAKKSFMHPWKMGSSNSDYFMVSIIQVDS